MLNPNTLVPYLVACSWWNVEQNVAQGFGEQVEQACVMFVCLPVVVLVVPYLPESVPNPHFSKSGLFAHHRRKSCCMTLSHTACSEIAN